MKKWLPILGLLAASAAWAQSPPPPPGSSQSSGTTSPSLQKSGAGARVSAVTSEVVTLSGFPVIAAKLPELAGDPRLKNIPLDSVILQGRAAASQPTENGQTVAVDWYGVTTSDRTKAAQLVEPLKGRFLSKSGTIPAGVALPAKGNLDGLVTAIQSLYENKAQEKPAEQPTKPKQASQAAPSASGTPSGNDVASAYKPLTVAPETAVAEPKISTGTTLDGCSPRVDPTQGVVIQQSATTTTTDGVTTKGACSDTEVRWPIKTTSAECSDDVQIGELKAYPQEKTYYVDAGGATIYLGTCQRKKDVSYPITTDAKNCTVFADTGAMLATEATELVYTNANNARVVAEACSHARAGAKTWPITKTANGCTRRDDFTARKSYDQVKPIYVRDGVTVAVSDCADDGAGYDHVMDVAACTATSSIQAMTATEMGKWKITTPTTGLVYISECIPTGTTGALVKTIEGCESNHTDYMEAGYSRGSERYYHMLTGARTYITNCQENTTTYTHDYVQTGWQNDDGAKTATNLLAVYIDLPAPAGRTLISAGSVRAQSTTQAYALTQSDVLTPDGTSTYVGCNAYRNNSLSDVYTRPDGTTYSYAKGTGTPTGPIDVCISINVKSAEYLSSRWCSNSTNEAAGTNSLYGSNYSLLNKVQKKNTETGEILSTICAEQSVRGTTDGANFRTCNADAPYIGAYWTPWTTSGTRYPDDPPRPWPGSYAAAYGAACPNGF